MPQSKSSQFGHKAGPASSRADEKHSASRREIARRSVTIIAVISILAVIATSTFVALRQGVEQDHSLRTIEVAGRLRHDLDQLQQTMLDEHGALYTSIATTPFYRRADYSFPLAELLKLTRDARDSCRDNNECVSRLDDLDNMIGRLSELSNELARKVSTHPGSVAVGDPRLEEIDTHFYSVLERVVDVRLAGAAEVESVVSQSSTDGKWASRVLLTCGVAASLMLLSLIYWNGRISRHLRGALLSTEEARARYQQFFEQHPLPIWVTDDATLQIVSANSAAERAFGFAQEELLCLSLSDLRVERREVQLVQHRQSGFDGPRYGTQPVGVWTYRTRAGERLSMDVHQLHIELDGRPATMEVMVDVTTLVQYQEQLRHQARYDSLTSLPNRAQLNERLTESIERVRATGGEISVLFLDLDRFKDVNDSLGHRVGDLLLAAVAERLERLVRATDMVGRYGGDEFIVIAERAGNLQLSPMLDRLVSEMNEPFSVGEQELYVEASIGVSTYPHDGLDGDTLIRNADAAMYLAKSRGRNGYQFYKPELNHAAAEKLKLTMRLRRAAKAFEFDVAYQPQMDMVSGRIVGTEALLRWHDAELGGVSPAVFIPLAEETGLIQGIGTWVLRQACQQAMEWQRTGLPPVRVSVNVSPLQLERGDLASVVRSVLEETGWPARLLELEVTEGALMRNADEAERAFRELRGLGVKIAIDDFGTGYSSLSYLKRFSIDRIKIDRAFVSEIGNDAEFGALTLAVIAIADALKFDVIAEGVELKVHRDFLVSHGCLEAQGFLYSPAVSPEAFAELLHEGAAIDEF